jgi:hypothetical protein
MKKSVFFISAFLLLQFSVCGQFWMHNLPSGPEGEAYNDTLLNKKEIIKKEHIKKIAVYKNAPEGDEKAELLRAIYFNESGNIKYKEFFTPKMIGRGPSIYVLDTFYYNSSGYRDSIVSINKPLNAQNKVISVSKTINDTIIKNVNYGFFPLVNADSLQQSSSALYSQYKDVGGQTVKTMYDSFFYFAYFNRKGQMIASNMINGKGDTTTQCFYKYHEDGLLDTIDYSNTDYKDVFVRREVNGQKLVILNCATGNLEWFYNKKDQWVKFIFYPGGPYQKSVSTKVSYKYNSNGTLSVVKIEWSGNSTVKYFYSYEK